MSAPNSSADAACVQSLAPGSARLVRATERVGLAAALLTPLFLMHGRAIAEGSVALADACFLLRCAVAGKWDWMRRGWVLLGFAWWAWLLLCSLPIPAINVGEGGMDSAIQAAATVRFLLFAASLQFLYLREPNARRWMYGVIAASVAWIAANVLLQFLTGHNVLGYGPAPAGELTGPFDKPRAGPPLARLILPVVVPVAAGLLTRRRWTNTVAAAALLLAAACIVLVISQRMPTVLTAAGLALSALLLPRLRPFVLLAFAAGGLLLATSAVVSPPTWKRVVVQFSSQIENFGQSHYGFLYQRSMTMAAMQPLTGRGYDGFRTGCPSPSYGEADVEAARARFNGAEVCTPHPHNFYMQAVTDGGYPGLLLFCALAIAWLVPIGRGLWGNPDPLRVGLFASLVVQLWPVQSTSSFFSMPMAGWFFLLLGWALAESLWAGRATPETTSGGRHAHA